MEDAGGSSKKMCVIRDRRNEWEKEVWSLQGRLNVLAGVYTDQQGGLKEFSFAHLNIMQRGILVETTMF